MIGIMKCPFCGTSEGLHARCIGGFWFIGCETCGGQTGLHNNEEEAIQACNQSVLARFEREKTELANMLEELLDNIEPAFPKGCDCSKCTVVNKARALIERTKS